MEVTTYTAIVTRSAPGWSIYVPQVERHTYAAQLREIEDMARDLVQVMTELPDDEIDVAVQLPEELANPIAAMRSAREAAERAEAAARDAQRAAATALRNSGAPLRDIASALGISHQRVHQILEAAEVARQQLLDRFFHDIDVNLKYGQLVDFELPVTDDSGNTPVVVALAEEPLTDLAERLDNLDWDANVFILDANGVVHFAAVVNEACAIGDPSADMTGLGEQPGEGATVGMFFEYVRQCRNGVVLSAAAPRPACVREAQTLDLILA